MLVSLPPGRTTAHRQSRLRRTLRGVSLAVLVALVAPFGAPIVAGPVAEAANAHAAPPAPRILTRATVTDRARGSMPVALWTRFVGAYAGPGSEALPDDAAADAAGCRKLGGDYLATATFDVRDDLPGMPNASDRPSGRARLTVVACADARTIVDRTVRIDGEPVSVAEAGTNDALFDAWRRAVPAGLADANVAIGRIARARRLDSGDSRCEIAVLLGTIPPNTVLADVATSTGSPRRPPLRLRVTRVTDAGVEAIAARPLGGDPGPAAGDTIEYVRPNADGTTGTAAPGAST